MTSIVHHIKRLDSIGKKIFWIFSEWISEDFPGARSGILWYENKSINICFNSLKLSLKLTKNKSEYAEFLSVIRLKSWGERAASSSKLLVTGNLEAVRYEMRVLEYALTSTKADKHQVAATILKDSCLNRTLLPEILKFHFNQKLLHPFLIYLYTLAGYNCC